MLAGLAGVVAMLLNPYGPHMLVHPFDREVASAFSPAIAEWGSPDFGAIELLPFRVLIAGLVLVAIWPPARSRDYQPCRAGARPSHPVYLELSRA